MSDDELRCTAAGVPDTDEFATKPELAMAMIRQAVDAGMPAAFVTGDEAYGLDPLLRAGLQDLGLGYVLAIARNRRIPVSDAHTERVNQVAVDLSEHLQRGQPHQGAWITRAPWRFAHRGWLHRHTDAAESPQPRTGRHRVAGGPRRTGRASTPATAVGGCRDRDVPGATAGGAAAVTCSPGGPQPHGEEHRSSRRCGLRALRELWYASSCW
ncbi:transposase [Catellatospora methionotrophica]|uniref:transposase n=1 Tax=Catellatospora methionotrophica TaxID=121620 RepID=UPI00140DA09F|nr:transposase [Catellatospora methionotrophica]